MCVFRRRDPGPRPLLAGVTIQEQGRRQQEEEAQEKEALNVDDASPASAWQPSKVDVLALAGKGSSST